MLNYHGTDSFELQWTQFILLLRLQSFEATSLPLFIRRRAAADSLTSMSLGTIFYLLYIKKTKKTAMQQGGSSFVGTCGPAVLSPADNWRSTAHTLTTPPTPSPSGRKPARLGRKGEATLTFPLTCLLLLSRHVGTTGRMRRILWMIMLPHPSHQICSNANKLSAAS